MCLFLTILRLLSFQRQSEHVSDLTLIQLRLMKYSFALVTVVEHKNRLAHKKTAYGKDFSNPFMVDNLPKSVGFSTHLASLVKSWLVQDQTVLALASPKANELAIPEQTATDVAEKTKLLLKKDRVYKFKKWLQRSIHLGTHNTICTTVKNRLDILFQSMFDELLTPPPSVDYPAPEVVAPIHEVEAPVTDVSTSLPSLTNVDQDAPSPSNSQTTPKTQPPVIPNDVEEDNHDIEVAHMGNDPFFGIPILEVHSDQSSSSHIIYTIVHPDYQIFEHNSK
ncbi:hypothetical protein Tco_0011839 [Tanacetum coccineum]